MILSHYVVWIAIYCFYVFEHVKLVPIDSVLVSYDSRARFGLHVARVPFLVGSKQLVVIPPLPLMTIFLPARLAPGDVPANRGRTVEARKIKLLWRAAQPFLEAEVAIFIFYFLILPGATYFMGLTYALLLFAPAQIGILVYAWWYIWRYQPARGDKQPCRLCLALEMIAVPGMIPALAKRLAFAHAPAGDAALLFYDRLPKNRRAGVLDRVRFRVGDLREYQEVSADVADTYLAALEKAS